MIWRQVKSKQEIFGINANKKEKEISQPEKNYWKIINKKIYRKSDWRKKINRWNK